MEGEKMTLNLTAAAEKVVLQRAMFPPSGFFMPVSGCLSPWAPWGAATSKLAPSEDWGEEVAELMPATLLAPAATASAVAEKCPRDAKTWHALGKRARCLLLLLVPGEGRHGPWRDVNHLSRVMPSYGEGRSW